MTEPEQLAIMAECRFQDFIPRFNNGSLADSAIRPSRSAKAGREFKKVGTLSSPRPREPEKRSQPSYRRLTG